MIHHCTLNNVTGLNTDSHVLNHKTKLIVITDTTGYHKDAEYITEMTFVRICYRTLCASVTAL